jgi:hypothetical protein
MAHTKTQADSNVDFIGLVSQLAGGGGNETEKINAALEILKNLKSESTSTVSFDVIIIKITLPLNSKLKLFND